MMRKNHPEFIPHPQPPPIMPPPWPVLIWAQAEILKTKKTVKTIINCFIFFLLSKVWCDSSWVDYVIVDHLLSYLYSLFVSAAHSRGYFHVAGFFEINHSTNTGNHNTAGRKDIFGFIAFQSHGQMTLVHFHPAFVHSFNHCLVGIALWVVASLLRSIQVQLHLRLNHWGLLLESPISNFEDITCLKPCIQEGFSHGNFD